MFFLDKGLRSIDETIENGLNTRVVDETVVVDIVSAARELPQTTLKFPFHPSEIIYP